MIIKVVKHLVPLAAALSLSSAALAQQAPSKLPEDVQEEINNAIDSNTAPLTEDEINRALANFNKTQRASRNRYPNAETKISTEVISNAPGSKIPTLHAGVGFVTNIVFKDAGGQPWPIEKDSVGNGDAFGTEKIDEHILQVTVKEPNSFSNLSFLLEGQSTLTVVNLRPPTEFIDVIKTYVLDSGLAPASVQRYEQAAQSNDTVHASINRELNLFLDGTPPEAAVTVPVQSGPAIDIWRYKEKLIVKTQMRITVPSAESEPLYGNDDWRVYSIANPVSTMAFIHNGSPKLVSISESAIAGMNE